MTLPTPIVQYLRKIKGTPEEREVLAVLGVSASSSSGKSPSGKRSPPYWAREIQAVDPECPNGYGIEGPFANTKDFSSLDEGTYLIFKYNGAGVDQHLLVLKRTNGKVVEVEFPSGKTKMLTDVELMHAATEYRDVVSWMCRNTAIKKFVSDKRPRTAAA